MRKILVPFSLLLCLLPLVACSSQQAQPTFLPSSTPIPSATFTPSPIPSPTQTHPPTLTPSPTSTPYPIKQVLLEYGLYEGHGLFEDILSPNIPDVILYPDGQLIITRGQFREKELSPSEINDLLSQLEQMGLFTIETNQKHDLSDPLYNFGNNYPEVFDGGSYCISVYSINSRELCAYEPFKEFLTRPMKNLLAFLDRYNPKGMSIYHPDRILLEVQQGSDFLPEEYRTTPIEWTNTLPPLQSSSRISRIFAEGETAEKIFALFDYSAKWQIFIENGSEYTVFARPVLPHESLSQP
jgi:hypothetical protein